MLVYLSHLRVQFQTCGSIAFFATLVAVERVPLIGPQVLGDEKSHIFGIVSGFFAATWGVLDSAANLGRWMNPWIGSSVRCVV